MGRPPREEHAEMLYRVQCIERATGAEGERVYHADNPERAAQMAIREGYIVGGVTPEAGGVAAAPPAAPHAGGPGRLAAYAARAGTPSGLRAFLNFEVFLFPVLIRVAFAVSLGLTLVISVLAPVHWLFFEPRHDRESALITLLVVAWSWVWVIGVRIVSEVWTVFFSVHEQLREINRNTRQEG